MDIPEIASPLTQDEIDRLEKEMEAKLTFTESEKLELAQALREQEQVQGEVNTATTKLQSARRLTDVICGFLLRAHGLDVKEYIVDFNALKPILRAEVKQ